MDKYIFKGRTKESAILEAEKTLNKDRKFLLVNVLNEPDNKTMFSILDRNNVTIEVTIDKEKEALLTRNAELEKRNKSLMTDEILNKNIDVIKNFLDNLNKQNLRLNINYTISIKNKEIHVNLDSENNAILIGSKGKMLDAFQTFLQNLIYIHCKPSARIYVDVNGYNLKRKTRLEGIARENAYKAMETKTDIALDPMSSYERKIVHNTLLEFPSVKSESEGREPHRYIVIKPL